MALVSIVAVSLAQLFHFLFDFCLFTLLLIRATKFALRRILLRLVAAGHWQLGVSAADTFSGSGQFGCACGHF